MLLGAIIAVVRWQAVRVRAEGIDGIGGLVRALELDALSFQRSSTLW
ncbi:hypothetical protein ACFSLT_19815 [Novosphingobium resinovorum]